MRKGAYVGVTEWLMVLVQKTRDMRVSVGSNPTTYANLCGIAGIGRRTALRSLCRKACQFESSIPHQYAFVAQMVKHMTFNHRSTRSSRVRRTNIGGSFNGRTRGFDPRDVGSIPAPLANYTSMAQRIRQRTSNPWIVGSSPARRTTEAIKTAHPVSQVYVCSGETVIAMMIVRHLGPWSFLLMVRKLGSHPKNMGSTPVKITN